MWSEDAAVFDFYESSGDLCYHVDSTSTPSGDNTLVYTDASKTVLATVETKGS